MSRIFALVLFILTVNQGVAQNEFNAIFYKETRSAREDIKVDFKDSYGNEASLPIAILKGKHSGPVFTIIAGVHGYEYPPIMAVQGMLQEIDLKQLKGTIVIVPIANKASFFTRTPFINPQDQKNLNNAFPGRNDGSITEQIAYYITHNLIAVSDVVLDVHGGDACEDLLPFVCYYNNEQKPKQTALAKKLSENSGFEYVVSYPYTIADSDPAKYVFKQAVQDGKTALSIECGKLGTVQDDNVQHIKSAIYNMLYTMDMYAKFTGGHKKIVYKNSQDYINATVQGIFYSSYKAGDTVAKDAIVGYTTDEFGNVLEEYKATKNGIVLYMLATPPVNSTDTIMCISSFEKGDD